MPTVLRNAKFGQSSSRGRIDDLGCIGWENHLSQCEIHDGGTCQHAADSAVQCTSKFTFNYMCISYFISIKWFAAKILYYIRIIKLYKICHLCLLQHVTMNSILRQARLLRLIIQQIMSHPLTVFMSLNRQVQRPMCCQ